MDHMAAYVFVSSVIFILYILIGYPLWLAVLSFGSAPRIRKQWTPRTVSILLPVHNGERWIRDKLETIAQLDYPRDFLQILAIEDGSTDRTADLIREIAAPGLELLSIPHSGKAAALNAGLNRATGEILLYTDVRQRLDPGSLRSLIECFADPSVGVASGELVIGGGETRQEADIGLYWCYEKWIRKRLSRLGVMLGASGCFYAMRRELAVTLPPNTLLDDVHLPLAAFFKGYRIILDEGAYAFDYPTALKSEFRRKVRTQAGLVQIIARYPRLLLPTTRIWFHFGSHKLGRLLLPYALVLVAISSVDLPQGWAQAAVIMQAAFYGLALMDAWIPGSWPLKRPSSIARTFVVLVGAALCAVPAVCLRRYGMTGWATTNGPVDGSELRNQMALR
jgi:poly-beta-1,6-N-acetyl-D-glucosamine synthase